MFLPDLFVNNYLFMLLCEFLRSLIITTDKFVYSLSGLLIEGSLVLLLDFCFSPLTN